jgi:glycine/D-amino acid oxidase-like deaminating enzyme
MKADIVIIGAGYAGASTVYHLLEKSNESPSEPSIVILEAREACSGATGRNGMISSPEIMLGIGINLSTGGHLKPDLYNRPDSIAAEFGIKAAAEATAFEAEHVEAIKELVEKEKIDCDLVVTRAADVQFEEPIRDKLKVGYDRLAESGIAAVKGVSFSSGEKAEAMSSLI